VPEAVLHVATQEDSMERTREFVSNRLNRWNLAIVEDGKNGIEDLPLAGRSRILILARGEQYAEIDIDTASDVYLVHSSVFYPGWVATVDGHETPIYPAYFAIRVERNQGCRRQSHTSAGIQTALFLQ